MINFNTNRSFYIAIEYIVTCFCEVIGFTEIENHSRLLGLEWILIINFAKMKYFSIHIHEPIKVYTAVLSHRKIKEHLNIPYGWRRREINSEKITEEGNKREGPKVRTEYRNHSEMEAL